MKVARVCQYDCRIDEIIAGSTRLQHDSLVYLVRLSFLEVFARTQWTTAHPTHLRMVMPLSESASQLCTDLLTQITLLNEHRILMIWVLVYEHMADIIASELSPKPRVDDSQCFRFFATCALIVNPLFGMQSISAMQRFLLASCNC